MGLARMDRVEGTRFMLNFEGSLLRRGRMQRSLEYVGFSTLLCADCQFLGRSSGHADAVLPSLESLGSSLSQGSLNCKL